MKPTVPVDHDHPANLDPLREIWRGAVLRTDQDSTYDLDEYRTRTHPDLAEWLYGTLGAALPVDCRGTAFGDPVLVCPENGVIFAWARGMGIVALRLPGSVLAQALAAGATDVLEFGRHGRRFASDLGADWAFVRPFQDVERVSAWFRAAYDHACALSDHVADRAGVESHPNA